MNFDCLFINPYFAILTIATDSVSKYAAITTIEAVLLAAYYLSAISKRYCELLISICGFQLLSQVSIFKYVVHIIQFYIFYHTNYI